MGRKILELKTTTGSAVGSPQETKARAVKIKSNLKKHQETIAVSAFCKSALAKKVSSMTDELSPVCVDRTDLRADQDEMTTLVRRMNEDVKKSLSTVSTEAQKTYEDVVVAFKRKHQEGLEDGWNMMRTYFEVASALLAVTAEYELL